MSEILFKRLQIENFLSIGEGSIDLNGRGLLLIQGVNDDDPSANSNGAGKSSTVDALCWALYGTTNRGLSGDAVVNRFEGKNCRVSITFELNGKTYEVARHRKHKAGKNRLLFSCDGDDLTLGTDKLTQELIERTIGCSLEVFQASIYAGQGNMPNLPSMTDKELKQLVENAAGIELLDAAYAIARERARSATQQVQVAELQLTNAQRDVQRAEDAFKDVLQRESDWNGQQAAKIADFTRRLAEGAGNAKKLKEELDAADEAGLTARVKDLEDQLAASHKPQPVLEAPNPPVLKSEPAELPRIAALRADIRQGEREQTRLRDAIRSDLELAKDLTSTVGTPCGECGKPYHEEDLAGRKAALIKAAQTSKARLDEVTAQVAADTRDLELALENHKRECEQVRADNEKLRAKYQAALEEHQRALQAQRDAAAASDSTKIVASLREAQSALQRISGLRGQLTAALAALRTQKEQLERMKLEVNPYTAMVIPKTEALQQAKEDYDRAFDATRAAQETAANADIVSELYSPKGMRGEVLDSVTPFLNARTAQYLGTLSDGQITAEWKTIGTTVKGEAREQFHIAVNNTNGAETYEGLSGGEQRKVRISTAMALQDLVASRADRPIKLFIGDELDDALDVSGLERLMSILEDKARHVGTVLVVSHNDVADWISNQLTVIKTGGKSHIVEV